jgi:hypothetical protein
VCRLQLATTHMLLDGVEAGDASAGRKPARDAEHTVDLGPTPRADLFLERGDVSAVLHSANRQRYTTRIFGSSHTGSHLHTCAGWDGRFSHGFGVLYEVRGHAGWAIVMGITVSEAVTIEAVRSNRGRIPPYTHTMRISHRQHGYALWRCSADTCHPASRSGYLPSRCPLLSP